MPPVDPPPFLAVDGQIGRLLAQGHAPELGPPRQWPAPLRAAVAVMLSSPQPMLVWWGERLHALYNDAYRQIIGDKHPVGLGRPGAEVFPEIWADIGPLLAGVLAGGPGVWVDDQRLVLMRHGYPEETYWTYSMSPIRDDDGRIVGLFSTTNDTTERVVGERRLNTLRTLGGVSARAGSPPAVGRAALAALATDRTTVPFAALYLEDPGGDPGRDAESDPTAPTGLRLVASFGIAECAPLPAVADDPDGAVQRCLRTAQPMLIDELAEHCLDPADPAGVPADDAMVLPLLPATDDAPTGVLVLGRNRLRPLDDGYRGFLNLVGGQVAAALSDADAFSAQQRRAEALAELDRAKSDFFTGVSHEFRTPLTLMLGPVEELRAAAAATDPHAGTSPVQIDAVREALDTVHRNGIRLTRLVDTLLEFSRLQAGRVRADRRPVDLAALTAELAGAFRSATDSAGLALVVDCADLGGLVAVDPDLWERVVLNLVANAVKFTLTGRITVTQNRPDGPGGPVVLRVADTGSGIPAEHVDRVFDRFHRVENTLTRSHEGSGIGLALVRELVELHGGTVTVTSTVGVGSEFVVRLPAPPVDPPAQGPVPAPATAPELRGFDRVAAYTAESATWRAAAPAGGEGTAAGAGGVLIADDNADMRDYLTRLIAPLVRVRAVGDGLDALTAATDDPPDLVVSDVMMPRLDGLALVAALREDPRTAAVPVLLLSARAGSAASVQGLAAGADDYLVKPFAAAELVARVRAHLRLATRRRAATDAESGAATVQRLAPATSWVADPDGRWEHVSGGWAELTGSPTAGLLDQGWQDLLHPEDRSAHRDRIAAARAEGVGWESEFRLRTASGEYRRLIEHVVPVTTDDPDAPDGRRVTGWVGSCVDITARHARETRRTDDALFAERERYRILVAQAPVGIWTTDDTGRLTYVNDQLVRLTGRSRSTLLATSWPGVLDRAAADPHRDPAAANNDADADDADKNDKAAADADDRASWRAALAGGTAWAGALRLTTEAGEHREIRSSARPLRDPDGAVNGFLGVVVDVTDEQRTEQTRRAAAADQAARRVSEAAAARLRAMVQGLAAIVWEAEWDAEAGALRFSFVSDRAEELLGYPAARWRDDEAFWPAVVHPDDRERVLTATAAHTAAGRDHDLTYRAVAVDGRIVWLHQVVHVMARTGGARQAQGLTVDVTLQRRAERSSAVLARSGRIIAGSGPAEERITALARLAADELSDGVSVALATPHGTLRRIAVCHDDDTVAAAIEAISWSRLGAWLPTLSTDGTPVLLPLTDPTVRTRMGTDIDAAAWLAAGVRSALVVPLVVDGAVAGLLSFLNAGTRSYDPTDRDLAAELGRRASMVLAADRSRSRERHIQQLSTELAAAAGVRDAARLLNRRLADVLSADAVGFLLADPDRGLRMIDATGYPDELMTRYAVVRSDDPAPVAVAARTGDAQWLSDRGAMARRWPDGLDQARAHGWHAAAALPLTASGRLVGAVALRFATERPFPPDERVLATALVAQAASALERAATADERRLIAETLQTSLLPARLPDLAGLALAARYLSGAHGTQAGGDWYDVIELDPAPGIDPAGPAAPGRVAIAVGDVVGQGARAAAVMGQLRSALSGYLLEGHDPVSALERVDLFAARVAGAAGSTAACLVLEPTSGELTWARAGHPPPLITGPDGVRLLEDAVGTVLAVRGRPPYRAGRARLAPGESIVLYTDGLVERRGELVDDGVARLAAAAGRHHGLGPDALADALLHDALGPGSGPADDVAVIAARLLPDPLQLSVPALAPVLREVRATVADWAQTTGLDADDTYDLQLALGEAAANAVEHAYRDAPAGSTGSMDIAVRRAPDGTVHVGVRDRGVWRPPPDERGFRGRGLDLIRDVGAELVVQPAGPDGEPGTEVRFVLPVRRHPTPTPATTSTLVPPSGAATVHIEGRAPVLARLGGELDLAGVAGIREELMGLLTGPAGADVVLDLRATTFMASAGVALLVEAERVARTARVRLRLHLPVGGVVRRALAVSGVDQVFELFDSAPDRP